LHAQPPNLTPPWGHCCAQGIIFFYVGASATNFLIRLSIDLHHDSGAHGVLELVKASGCLKCVCMCACGLRRG